MNISILFVPFLNLLFKLGATQKNMIYAVTAPFIFAQPTNTIMKAIVFNTIAMNPPTIGIQPITTPTSKRISATNNNEAPLRAKSGNVVEFFNAEYANNIRIYATRLMMPPIQPINGINPNTAPTNNRIVAVRTFPIDAPSAGSNILLN